MMHPHVHTLLLALRHVLDSPGACAPKPASQVLDYHSLNHLTQEIKAMALDLSRLRSDIPAAVSALQQLPGLKQQVADLQAKLDAAPHDDPTVQTDVDALADSLDQALNALKPVTEPAPVAAAPAPAGAAPSDATPATAASADAAPAATPAPTDAGASAPAPTGDQALPVDAAQAPLFPANPAAPAGAEVAPTQTAPS